MKNYVAIIILSFVSVVCSAQQHRALIVGVANYPEGSGWGKINSDNDVALLKGLLADTYRIKTLVDENATLDNIKKELLRLESDASKGDTIIISFSCHGQQMTTNDVNETDLLDEALIPYDAQAKYSDRYQGENHLRDNILSDCVNRIRKRTGREGFVLVLLDACHSGDSYRKPDSIVFRGKSDVFGPQDRIPNTKKSGENRLVASIASSAELADVIYIGACQSNQCNAEMITQDNERYGSLSYAFYETYLNNKLADLETLCLEIKEKISGYNKKINQNPEFAFSNVVLNQNINRQIDDSCIVIPPECDDEGIAKNVGYCLIFLLATLLIALLIWRKK